MYELLLLPGERVILYEQGGYSSGRTWKLGHLYLTDKRVIFGQTKRTLFNVALWDITDITLHKRAFILATRDCLRLSYRDEVSGRHLVAFIVAPHLDVWIEEICGLLWKHGIDLGVQVQEEIAQWESSTLRHRWERETGFGRRPVPGTIDLLSRVMYVKAAGGDLPDAGFHFLYTGPRLSRGPNEDIKTGLQLRREQIADEQIRRSEEMAGARGEEFGDLGEFDWWGSRVPQTQGEELAQVRLERAEEKAGLRPGRKGVNQARWERLKEILAEAVGAETGSLARARLNRALGKVPGGQAEGLTEASQNRIREILAEIEAHAEGTETKEVDIAAAVRKTLAEIQAEVKDE